MYLCVLLCNVFTTAFIHYVRISILNNLRVLFFTFVYYCVTFFYLGSYSLHIYIMNNLCVLMFTFVYYRVTYLSW